MIDYYESEDFSRTVFTVEDGEIVEHILSDICRDYAEETTSPRGAEPKFHVRGNELWTWGHNGQFPEFIDKFETEAEAEHALLLTFRFDLYNNDDSPIIHDTREDAEKALRELQDENV